MPKRKYQVRFSRPKVGPSPTGLADDLKAQEALHGKHLPPQDLGGECYQVRDLQKVGKVWKGTFGKLREDAPHLVTSENEERELTLGDGDRLLEKCHFLYRENDNLIVWQLNRASGGMSRFETYLSLLIAKVVLVPPITNEGKIEEILSRSIYEISYSFDRPPSLAPGSPKWNKRQFEVMKQIDAGFAKFDFRAERGGQLSATVKAMVREALGQRGIEKIRIRLTDESDPIELFAAPLKDKIVVEQIGRYPEAADIFTGLEQAYDRNKSVLARDGDSNTKQED